MPGSHYSALIFFFNAPSLLLCVFIAAWPPSAGATLSRTNMTIVSSLTPRPTAGSFRSGFLS